MIFVSQDIVLEKGAPATCCHFIVHGKVRVENPIVHAGKVLYLKPPSWLGDICLFVDTLRKNTVIAVVTTETLVLNKSTVKAVCNEFPAMQIEYEAFRQRLLADKWDSLVCPRCKDIGHSEENCPLNNQQASRSASNKIYDRSKTFGISATISQRISRGRTSPKIDFVEEGSEQSDSSPTEGRRWKAWRRKTAR
jgi:hypothetical protein